MNKKQLASFIFAVAVFVSATVIGHAQCVTAGCLDTSFGDGGRQLASVGTSGNGETGTVLQADGKIVSLLTVNNTTMRNSIVRLTPDGNIDPTFDIDGYKNVIWSAPEGGFASTMARQIVNTQNGPEERFVIAGNFPSGRNKFYLRIERYTNAGALDTTFGVNGFAFFNFNVPDCASAVQPDQKILIGCGGLLVRLNANGTPDSTFGSGGVSQANHGVYIRGLNILPDGRILGTGESSQGKNKYVAVARFNPNGSLDTSFGMSGKALANIGNGVFALAAAVDFTGNILVVGEVQIGGTAVQNYDAFIVRFTPGGQFDTSFGNGGAAILNIANQQDEFTSITLFNDKIIAAGEGRTASGLSNVDYLVARYNLNGTLDNTFGNGGVVLYNFLGSYDHAGNVSIQSDPGCGGCPKLIVAGGVWANIADPQAPRYAGFVRFIL